MMTAAIPAARWRGLPSLCAFVSPGLRRTCRRRPVRRPDRVENGLRIGRLRHRFRDYVAVVALVRVVAAEFFQQRNDFGRFLLWEDRELQRQLISPRREFVV